MRLHPLVVSKLLNKKRSGLGTRNSITPSDINSFRKEFNAILEEIIIDENPELQEYNKQITEIFQSKEYENVADAFKASRYLTQKLYFGIREAKRKKRERNRKKRRSTDGN